MSFEDNKQNSPCSTPAASDKGPEAREAPEKTDRKDKDPFRVPANLLRVETASRKTPDEVRKIVKDNED
jgi:hypothetical protein